MKRFSNVLAVVNPDRNDASALHRAVSLANSNLAALTVVSVLEELPGDLRMSLLVANPAEIRDIAAAEERDQLEELVSVVEAKGVPIEKKVLAGRPFIELIRQVLGGNHDLVIKNIEPSEGLLDVFFSSTDMHLLRKCPCPVWIIKPGHKHFRRILACIDFDPGGFENDALNRQIIEMATSLAAAESSELHIINALEEFGERFLKFASIANTIVELEAVFDEQEKTRR
ncbi:universal stress protein [Pseudomonadota bacterium]